MILKKREATREEESFGLGEGEERKRSGAKAQQWKDRTKGRERLIWLVQSLCREAAGNNAENSILKLISSSSTYK